MRQYCWSSKNPMLTSMLTSMTCVVDKEETRTRREAATPASRLSSTNPTPRPLVAF